MKRRLVGWRGALSLVASMTLVVASPLVAPARADLAYELTVEVLDRAGVPIPGVHVYANEISVGYTDAAGRVVIAEPAPGPTVLTVSKAGKTSSERRTHVSTSSDPEDATEIFYLDYFLEVPVLEMGWYSTALSAKSFNVLMTSTARANACAGIIDGRKNETVPATPQEPLWWPGWWTARIDMSQGSAEGTFSVTGYVTDCASGIPIARTRTANPPPFQYGIDNSPPVLTKPAVTDDRYVNDASALEIYVIDPLSGIEPGFDWFCYERAVLRWDDGNFASGCIDEATGRVSATRPNWTGPTTLIIDVPDQAGNPLHAEIPMLLDTVRPAIGLPGPQGNTKKRSPLISAPVTESTSGIDLSRSYLAVQSKTTGASAKHGLQFDVASSRVYYQVPTDVQSAAPAGHPMVEGTYVCTLNIYDGAGNLSTRTWTFTVTTV
ncbi:MAG TPA: carboxypeptidase-like regulatory domain-containing protein [Acidimicrobiales bacterium]|nr:carboxypeptidase-like regulatory domain-containing protein [Acidimicrobiales bacterium]